MPMPESKYKVHSYSDHLVFKEYTTKKEAFEEANVSTTRTSSAWVVVNTKARKGQVEAWIIYRSGTVAILRVRS